MPMPQDTLIAVTGATGAVGTRVSARLAEAGARQRLVVRNASRAPRHAGAEIRQAAGYGADEEMRAALQGADTIFLIPAAETPDRVQQHKTAVDAAVAAGVGRIVYLSFFGAAPDATFTLARDHWHTEEHIRATGVPWTFLRMNLYMDFIPSMVLPEGVIKGPAGHGRLAAILRDDVAAAAAAVLTSDGHDGRPYDLTGREAFSLAQAAGLMSRLTGKAIRFQDETDEEAFAARAVFGAPDFEVRGWVSSYQAIRDGSLEAISLHVRELTGRDPVTLAQYLQAHPEALDHVTGARVPNDPQGTGTP
jgi:NAD(P)H dehydrogenase (quinone)